jgi:hypothetical protein
MVDVASVVRSQALSAGIAAALLLYFGFTSIWFSAAVTLEFTLKVGGIAMAVSTVLLITGIPFALLFDGVAAMVIGAGLALSGIRWCVDIQRIDFQGLLNFVFAAIFASSGWRNYQSYRTVMSATTGSGGENHGYAERPEESPYQQAPPPPPDHSLGSQLLDRARHEPRDEAPAKSQDPPIEPTPTTAAPAAPFKHTPSEETEDVPEGFLSSFANPQPDEENH